MTQANSTCIAARRPTRGPRKPWRDDPALVRQYLRIYREVRQDGLAVALVARDHGYSRMQVYRIVAQVERYLNG